MVALAEKREMTTCALKQKDVADAHSVAQRGIEGGGAPSGLKNMPSGRLMAGDERSTAVTLLLSKFSSVDLWSTDVTIFT